MAGKQSGIVEVIIRAKDLTGRVVSDFRRRFSAVTRVVTDMTKALVAGTAAMAAMVFTLTKLGQRGDEVLGVKQAFARATDNEAAALERLREASGGTISDFDLMRRHNQALALGTARSTDEFARMLRISDSLSKSVGIDATEAMEKFANVVASGSTRAARELGLEIRAGMSRNEIIAAAEKVMLRLAGAEVGGADAADRFATAISNAKDKLSAFVAQSPMVAEFFNRMTTLVEDLVDIVTSDIDLVDDAFFALGRAAANGFVTAFKAGMSAVGRIIAQPFEDDAARIRARGGSALDLLGSPDASMGTPAPPTAPTTSEQRMVAALESLHEIAEEARRRNAARASAAGGGLVPGGPPPAGIDLAGLGEFDPRTAAIRQAMGFRMQIAPTPFRSLGDFGFDPESLAAYRAGQERVRHAAAGPALLRPTLLTGLQPTEEGGGVAGAALGLENASQVAVESFRMIGEAAIDESARAETAILGMLQNIVANVKTSSGGLFGSTFLGGLVGVGLGLASSLFSRNRDPMPVRVSSYDPQALSQMKEATGPTRVTTIVEQNGVEIERIEHNLYDRQNRDEIARYSPRTGHVLRG